MNSEQSPLYGIEDFNPPGKIFSNLSSDNLQEHILKNGEGRLADSGALMVDTGQYTGRSPKDKYFVDEKSSSCHLWWGPINSKISEDIFDELLREVTNYYSSDKSDTYVFEGFAGADSQHRISVRMIAKKAWQALFCFNMFIRPDKENKQSFTADFTIINASDVKNHKFKIHGMNSETFIIFHLGRRLAIIGGTEYGGEMKKGIFSVLHYLLPMKGVLSMHCSANVDTRDENTALFFGLSGTGKTTLSTDEKRPLIGDDEHGWSENGVFNFEGGCYAKVIRLNSEEEPGIYNAIRNGALLENVVFDQKNGKVDYDNDSKTENTRVSYPINFIGNSLAAEGRHSCAGHPKKIIFLTCDAYGVLPPVAQLTPEQAMYHFISGYTAKVAGTERGIKEPTAVFSPCFGGPFLTLHPTIYAKLLQEKMKTHQVRVYLVNTGWVGASASSGADRISLPLTRKIIHGILDGTIEKMNMKKDPYFGFEVPIKFSAMDSSFLIPSEAWSQEEDYHYSAKYLVKKFHKNFKLYDSGNDQIKSGGPIS
ncbi:MAG: phosphoenolpyruvate carboxykinase (ATP) [Candidatus Marinimicrobia bacterium]|jgi:phosphoenolpyruvate carboxykinase (ATP)|nr:phosphoenolpyruvate carboxykinase (ATP) [Candidatus Neomarinimicrobiota bacterium]HJM46841.1 phosphoenolpyruvate carboxykinase (ATP) [Candidatus Neomarinimicrobiota bacterium]|tara:strand:- start:1365 stop:2975 length:1611 start_codon:yes stop_codon:yes gene_type:complete